MATKGNGVPQIVISFPLSGGPTVDLQNWNGSVPSNILLGLDGLVQHKLHQWRNQQLATLLREQPKQETEDATKVRFS